MNFLDGADELLEENEEALKAFLDSTKTGDDAIDTLFEQLVRGSISEMHMSVERE